MICYRSIALCTGGALRPRLQHDENQENNIALHACEWTKSCHILSRAFHLCVEGPWCGRSLIDSTVHPSEEHFVKTCLLRPVLRLTGYLHAVLKDDVDMNILSVDAEDFGSLKGTLLEILTRAWNVGFIRRAIGSWYPGWALYKHF